MEVVIVKKEQKEILRNLLEKYNYEFSQYTMQDVNELGLFGYDYLDVYWTEKNRYPYFIIVDNKLAGFIMINNYSESETRKTDYSISEFFILYKYRQKGIGREALFKVLDQHHGKWQLKYHPKNYVSKAFWNKVIGEYTNNNYELIDNFPVQAADYEDGTKASLIFFEN